MAHTFFRVKCTFSTNRLPHENTALGSFRSGCKRPSWWFSATLAILLAVSCSAQSQRGGRQGRNPGRPATIPGESQVRPTFEGDVKSISKKELFITSENGNGMKFLLTGKTTVYDNDKKIKASSLQVGQHLAVDAQINLDGTYDAVTVRIQAATSPHP